jgi:hypothetical protein
LVCATPFSANSRNAAGTSIFGISNLGMSNFGISNMGTTVAAAFAGFGFMVVSVIRGSSLAWSARGRLSPAAAISR